MDARAVPRLRGVFHLYAFFGAVSCGLVLVVLADGVRERFATCVYTAGLAAMFGASALYHRVAWRRASLRLWARRLDHSAIFLAIAGTYTPFALLAFTGVLPAVVLALVWGGAAAGVVLELVWIDAPRWLTALVYLLVGWVGLIAMPQLFSSVGAAGSMLVVAGGALYSLGALTYAARRPNPFPATLGFHEIFHLLVVAAAVTQFIAVSLLVL